MTKTLTEQWREGKLPRCGYYVKLLDGSIKQTNYDNISKTFNTEFFKYNVSIKEVLAPVPSYDEYNELKQDNKYLKLGIETRDKQIELLQKSLAIATKALKEINKNYRFTVAQDVVYKALKEMEGVK